MNLSEICPKEQIFTKESMAAHTTFKVGGPATCFVEIKTVEELKNLLAHFSSENLSYFVVGNGSNLLVSDKGFDGVILHIGEGLSKVEVTGDTIIAEAGAMLIRVANMAAAASLTGLEFASGIPGSVGGAVFMNAGAYGGEMKQVVKRVWCVDSFGVEHVFSGEEMDFSYRNSILRKEKMVATKVEFKLSVGEKEKILETIADLSQKRREKQPLEYPSAGSTFKRPEGYFAGKLIMDAGLRGYRVGGAQVAEKHCGFVINAGGATATDIYRLMEDVKEKVYAQFQVELEPEVIMLGEFSS